MSFAAHRPAPIAAAPNRQRRALLAAALGLLLSPIVSLAGCTPMPTRAPDADTPTPKPSPSPAPSPTASPTIAPVDPAAPISLTAWVPPEMTEPESETGAAFDQLNAAFARAHPRVRLSPVTKAPYGPGGLANMLRSTAPVVPDRLPDIAALDLAELHRLADTGLLQPLDGLLPDGLWDDELYPFAAEAATLHERRVAVPYQAEIAVAAHRGLDEVPSSWEDLLALAGTGVRYLFPAGQGDGAAADAFLPHYLSLEPTLVGGDGRVQLDTSATARVLRAYRAAMDAGVVPLMVRELRTDDDCWAALIADSGGPLLAAVSSRHLAGEEAEGIGYAVLPTVGGQPVPIARSWAWVIVTTDSQRQQLAAEYISAAIEPEQMAAWSHASGQLPTRRSALALAIDDEDYRAFLHSQLRIARPYPSSRDMPQLQVALVRAIEDVLDGVATPERAAVTAASAVARSR